MKAFKVAACVVFTLALTAGVYGQGISLDHVDGLTADGKIAPNSTVRFHLRLTNSYPEPLQLISNGFRVYSDDVDWTALDGKFNPQYPWSRTPNPFFDFGQGTWINIFTTGSDADTIGFAGLAVYSGGVPAGFDDVAFILEIGPIVGSGGTLVLDSSFWMPANYWIWASGGVQVDCDWGGPYSFEIADQVPVTYLKDDPIILAEVGDALTVYVENEENSQIVLSSVVLQGNVPPLAEPQIVGNRLEVDVSAVRFLASYRPIKSSTSSTYTIEYDKLDGNHVVLTGDVNIEVTEGDLTLDGIVDVKDAELLANYLWKKGTLSRYDEMMDLDGNGRIDSQDLSLLVKIAR